MLIPVYVFGFIFGGLVCFAIAGQISSRIAKICLRTIGVLAGPVFFIVVVVFSGKEREKTYEMTWLRGGPAADYLSYRKSDMNNYDDLIVLKRDIGKDHECYDSFVSSELAHYLETLQKHTVKVRYKITYDFYQARGRIIENIGDFGNDAASQTEISHGMRGGGEKAWSMARESCFTW